MNRPAEQFEPVTDEQVMEALRRAKASAEQVQARLHEPLAIIGVGCRFPKAADPDEFWRLLEQARDAVTDTPVERCQPTSFAGTRAAPDRRGAFLDSVDQFDAAFFGIAGREAASLDPQQRLLLEVTWETLEDAGLDPHRLRDSRTGVFVGICSSDYANRLAANPDAEIDPYWGTGNAHGVSAGRLSYCMDWRGPSAAFDTACSSSLTALHFATRSLRYGDCNLALVAGVNLMLAPELTITFDESGMLSPTGACHTFAAAADGFVRGEGCGAVLLKRLSQAIADGNRIYCVVRGSALNQDGRSIGLTAPNGVSQQSVIRRALADAGVKPPQVDYVEAHGTGTPLGDPIEMGALSAIFAPAGKRELPLKVGSVKTNIGHLEGAAGIAGLIKVCLAMEHEAIPPHLHFDRPSAHIDWTQPLEVPTKLTPWTRGDRPRIAGLSSFGFGGTNAHVVLEEAPLRAVAENGAAGTHLLTLSAKTPAALQELASRYARSLAEHSSLADVCYTAKVGRAHHEHRIAIAADSLQVLREKLVTFVRREATRDLVAGMAQPDLRVGWLFPGSATGIEIGQLRNCPDDFRIAFERYAEAFDELVEKSLAKTLQRPPSWWNSVDAQPSLFCLQLAAADLWRCWGLSPGYVVADGIGEYAAACAAGVLPLNDAVQLVNHHVEWLRSAGSSLKSREAFKEAVAGVPYSVPQFEYQGASGNAAQEVATPDYWLDHWRRLGSWPLPTKTLEPLDGTIGISLGVGFALANSGERAQHNGSGGCSGLVHCLAELYVAGAPLDWRAIESVRRPLVKLPTYPYQRKRHWYATRDQATGAPRPNAASPQQDNPQEANPLLGHRLDIGGRETIFEADLAQVPYLVDHCIGSAAVLPMAAFMELAISAGFHTAGRLLQVDDLVVTRAIAHTAGQTQRVQTVLSPSDDGFNCQIMVRAADGWEARATCRLSSGKSSLTEGATPISAATEAQIVEPAELYQRYRDFGIQHGPAFQKLSRLWVGDREAWGEIVADHATTGHSYLMHPTVLDACLQVVGGTLDSSQEHAWLPVRLAHYWMASADPTPQPLRVHATVQSASDDSSLRVDYTLCDAQDQLVAVVAGLVFEPVASRAVEPSDAADTATHGQAKLAQQFLQQPRDQRAAAVNNYLLGCVAHVMGVAAEEIPHDKPLGQLGLDSMMAYELQQEMLESLGLKVPMEEFLQDRNLQDWSHRLLVLLESAAKLSDHSSTEVPMTSSMPTNSHYVEGAI